MGIVRTALAITGYGSLAATTGFIAWTRKCRFADVSPTDHIYNTTLFARYNPNNAPVTQDICLRRIALDQIKPALLEKADDGKLVEAFCAGVWGGIGYAYQRRYLEKKYRGPATATQLWDRAQLKVSTYDVGTQITDHFEVVAKNASSIIVRCGDSPRITEVRASDGLFEMSAEIKREEGVVEFGLKSVFYNGLGKKRESEDESGPMDGKTQWLHKQYDKVLMESAVVNCTK
nr:hypothetical protein CFP56_22231 [Quercus suber]